MADSSEYCCSQRWIMLGNGKKIGGFHSHGGTLRSMVHGTSEISHGWELGVTQGLRTPPFVNGLVFLGKF